MRVLCVQFNFLKFDTSDVRSKEIVLLRIACMRWLFGGCSCFSVDFSHRIIVFKRDDHILVDIGRTGILIHCLKVCITVPYVPGV